jgi:hypothetical protein
MENKMENQINSLPKQIIVGVQRIAGKDAFVPICPKAKTFAELAGTKTITHSAMGKIRFLGYTVKINQPRHTLQSVFAK